MRVVISKWQWQRKVAKKSPEGEGLGGGGGALLDESLETHQTRRGRAHGVGVMCTLWIGEE